LNLRQDGTNLVFWFRNDLSVNQFRLAWSVPDVFIVDQTRDILFSYDGSNLSLCIDGLMKPHSYNLGPGAALVHWFGRARANELEGYNYVYYLLVFLPTGTILGVAVRKSNWRNFKMAFPIALGVVLPAILLEQILVSVSSRPISVHTIALSLCLIVAGCLWVNADRSM